MKKRLVLLVSLSLFICALTLNVYASGGLVVLSSTDMIEASDIVIALLVGLIGGLIIAFMVTGSMKAKMNTAVKKTQAKDYVRRGSFVLGQNYDRFLYEDTQKTRKQKDNN